MGNMGFAFFFLICLSGIASLWLFDYYRAESRGRLPQRRSAGPLDGNSPAGSRRFQLREIGIGECRSGYFSNC